MHERRLRVLDVLDEFLPLADWHVAELYDFAREMGASMIIANYSRYVIDVNRPASDAAMYEGQVATGLCPQHTFAGEPLYRHDAAVPAEEIAARVPRRPSLHHQGVSR